MCIVSWFYRDYLSHTIFQVIDTNDLSSVIMCITQILAVHRYSSHGALQAGIYAPFAISQLRSIGLAFTTRSDTFFGFSLVPSPVSSSQPRFDGLL